MKGSAVIKDFADKVARLTSKANFAEVVRQSLNEILGESAASAVIYHLGGTEALLDPEVFEERLKAIFGVGAKIILERIRKNLETIFSESLVLE